MKILSGAAWLASAGAVAAAVLPSDLAAGALLLISMALCALVLRGPDRVPSPWTATAAGVLLSVLTVTSFLVVITGYLRYTAPATLLLLAALGLCALAIALLVVASWLPGWPYREPVALALMTLAMGALSWHGLNLIGSTLTIPATDGSVHFYAYQPAGHHMYLNVGVTPSPGPGASTSEFLSIVNPLANKPVRWALLMTGDARLTRVTDDGAHVHERALAAHPATPGVLAEQPGELLWGRLPAGGTEMIQGQPLTSWTSHSPAQTAVSLPDFGPGSILNTDALTMSAVTRVLQGPDTSPSRIAIVIDAGNVAPLQTIVDAVPPLTDPYRLSWTTSTDVAPAYTLLDEGAQSTSNSYSFALAVLLGVAGAGLLASAQTFIHVAVSRRDQPEDS